MKQEDRSEFATAMQTLAAAFGKEPSKPLLEAYWMVLGELPIDGFKRAVSSALRSCKFMPSPAELREFAGDESIGLRAIRAWQAVRRAIREHGIYSAVSFDDPAINAAVRAVGGWRRLCSEDSEQMDRFVSREFDRLYREFSTSDLRPGEAASLHGLRLDDAPAPKLVLTGYSSSRALVKANGS